MPAFLAIPAIVEGLIYLGGAWGLHQALPGKEGREQALADAFRGRGRDEATMMDDARNGAEGSAAATDGCVGNCVYSADAPGKPTEDDGYEEPKRWDGKKVKNPNGSGAGWPDRNGDVWVPTGPGPLAHGGPHWDVQTPGGGYRNVYPGGRRR
jgi:hypothetical protein